MSFINQPNSAIVFACSSPSVTARCPPNAEAFDTLALNGATLIRNGNKITVAVPISYPRYAMAELVPFIKVQEGLFWGITAKGLVSHLGYNLVNSCIKYLF